LRIALGISYRGTAYCGWQVQTVARSVQAEVEAALARFSTTSIRTLCAGRTDTGVHGLNQVVHFDTQIQREPSSWVRGTNTFLPDDIAVQWCRPVADDFHARYAARGRRYAYVLLDSPVRGAIDTGVAGWTFRPLAHAPMQAAAAHLIGEHDFSAFRSSECQAASPVKLLRELGVRRVGAYWRFDFEGSAFLHHMVRNIMGCLVAVGTGSRDPEWMLAVLTGRNRALAAPTFPAAGLYFLGPRYDEVHDIPTRTPAFDWLPGTTADF
jgi:tRNA pseudouridine38-40 synthase